MAIIDITNKLTNEKPILKYGYKELPIDTSTPVMLKVMQMQENASAESIVEIVNLMLGESNAREFIAMPFADLQTVFIALMSAASGEDFETAEARFQDAKEQR